VKFHFNGQTIRIEPGDWLKARSLYRCEVHLLPERGGGFSALAVTLPGCASQGETVPEALENVREALAGVIWSYLEDGSEIPWLPQAPELPAGALRCWVFVPVSGPDAGGRP
jgi:predicted RNase H-like HicB family nuclease